MDFRKGLEISTEDFWYDLTDGGYIKPEEILISSDEAQIVNDAIKTLMIFRSECEDKIEGFLQ